MQVLVSAASKHESTAEIAERIGEVLRRRGTDVVVLAPEQVGDVGTFDAFVLGSAVYAGHWRAEAKELAHRVGSAQGSPPPVWLFSSGPIGDPPKPEEEPVDVAELIEATSAREHRVFAGRLERSRLSFGERAIVAALRVADGDSRDWDDIERWANTIADDLLS